MNASVKPSQHMEEDQIQSLGELTMKWTCEWTDGPEHFRWVRRLFIITNSPSGLSDRRAERNGDK